MNIISLGAGVQSTTMALMAAHGEITPMPDCAIFADTQFEPSGIYDHLDWLEKQLPFPVYRVTAGNIESDHLKSLTPDGSGKRVGSMPLFTAGGKGMSLRKCTREYKIDPIRKKIRELIGLKPRQPGPKEVVVYSWIGISTDEAMRMKPSTDRYIEHVWPLIDAGMSRNDCMQWFQQNFPGRTLSKSACVACPYHGDAMWRDMKLNDPGSFERAVTFDHSLRKNGMKISGMREQVYLHRSCQPLNDVDFRNLEDMGQINMFNEECEGMCGV